MNQDTMCVTLRRHLSTSDWTLGTLNAAGSIFTTLELGWHGNLPNRSRIPEGEYVLEPPEDGRAALRVVGGTVGAHPSPWTDRFGIYIHVANYVHELAGCIALGKSFSIAVDGFPCVMSSQEAVRKLVELVGENPARFIVQQAPRREEGVPILANSTVRVLARSLFDR